MILAEYYSCCKFVIIILANFTLDNYSCLSYIIYDFAPLEVDNGNWCKMCHIIYIYMKSPIGL